MKKLFVYVEAVTSSSVILSADGVHEVDDLNPNVVAKIREHFGRVFQEEADKRGYGKVDPIKIKFLFQLGEANPEKPIKIQAENSVYNWQAVRTWDDVIETLKSSWAMDPSAKIQLSLWDGSDVPKILFDYSPFKPPFRYDDLGCFIVDSEERKLLDLRGWGFLTGGGLEALGMSNEAAEKIQDSIGKRIVELINKDAGK